MERFNYHSVSLLNYGALEDEVGTGKHFRNHGLVNLLNVCKTDAVAQCV